MKGQVTSGGFHGAGSKSVGGVRDLINWGAACWRCENILLACEAHFRATIADLYDPEAMPDNLRQAHEHDEVLECIYIGRRFKNDTERLEKLFDLYTEMTASAAKPMPAKKAAKLGACKALT